MKPQSDPRSRCVAVARRGLGRGLALAGAGAMVLGGCGYASMVRKDFVRTYACPEERTVVVARDDLRAPLATPITPAQPPPEVAADPERMRLWQARVDAERQASIAKSDERTVYEARGCNEQLFYQCGLMPTMHPNTVTPACNPFTPAAPVPAAP